MVQDLGTPKSCISGSSLQEVPKIMKTDRQCPEQLFIANNLLHSRLQ